MALDEVNYLIEMYRISKLSPNMAFIKTKKWIADPSPLCYEVPKANRDQEEVKRGIHFTHAPKVKVNTMRPIGTQICTHKMTLLPPVVCTLSYFQISYFQI